MSKRERDKGLRGEREVRALVEQQGLAARGLEGQGDHLVVCADALTLHLEVKRQERIEIAKWCRQAEADAPAGTVPIVVFRRSKEPWRATLDFGHLLALLPRADETVQQPCPLCGSTEYYLFHAPNCPRAQLPFVAPDLAR